MNAAIKCKTIKNKVIFNNNIVEFLCVTNIISNPKFLHSCSHRRSKYHRPHHIHVRHRNRIPGQLLRLHSNRRGCCCRRPVVHCLRPHCRNPSSQGHRRLDQQQDALDDDGAVVDWPPSASAGCCVAASSDATSPSATTIPLDARGCRCCVEVGNDAVDGAP